MMPSSPAYGRDALVADRAQVEGRPNFFDARRRRATVADRMTCVSVAGLRFADPFRIVAVSGHNEGLTPPDELEGW